MIIKLTPEQVPAMWEVIKLAAVRAAEFPDSAIPAFSVKLLHELLSSTAQCYVSLNDERVVLQVFLTKVVENLFTMERELYCMALYSFKLIDDMAAIEGMEAMKAVATSQGCERLTTMSRHPRLWALYERLGWQLSNRQYVYPIKGV